MPMSAADRGPDDAPPNPEPSQPSDEWLLWREARLREEAEAVATDLKLSEQFGHLGDPVWVGSAALGLMVRPDLDITVACQELDESAVVALSGLFALQLYVRQVTYRDDTAMWNDEPETYPDGLYLGLKYCRDPEREWNLDIWFVDEPDRQPDLAHLRTLAPRLDHERRVAILRIKDQWARRPEYGGSVRGFDVYTAVLDDGVRTPSEFERWLMARIRT
jgi:hypothetical protein